MNSEARETLERIIKQRGQGISDHPKLVESLLRDWCGEHRREINILVGALEERIAADLINARRGVPREVLLAQLTQRLQDNLAYTREAARWAVDSWAVALGVISVRELQMRESIENQPPRLSSEEHKDEKSVARSAPREKVESADARENQITVENQNADEHHKSVTRPTLPPSTPRQTPTSNRGLNQPPPRATPQQQSPPPIQTPSPTQTPPRPQPAIPNPIPNRRAKPSDLWSIVFAPRRTSAPQAPRPQSPQPMPATLPTRLTPKPARGGFKFVGCLMTFIVLVALIGAAIFVAPAILSFLHEENSRPSINDPRIR